MIDPKQVRTRAIVTAISMAISFGAMFCILLPRNWANYVVIIQVINLTLLFNLGRLFPNSRH